MAVPGRIALLSSAVVLAACVSTYGMGAREIDDSWVGRDVGELRRQWNLTWFGGTSPNADGEYVHSANFGQNAGYETSSNSYVRATGPNTYEQVEETDTSYRERSISCVIEFHADQNNAKILRATVDGDCDGFARSWGAAPGYRGGGTAPADPNADQVVRRL